MRRSLESNSLVLIAKHTNPLYDDQWTEEGIIYYTGMGTVGDQSVEFGQNKTLAKAKEQGIKVYLFESYKDNEYYFNGEVELAGDITTAHETDAEGNMRKVLKYPLKLKNANTRIIVYETSLKNCVEIKHKEAKKISYDELRKLATKIENKTYSKEVITTYRDRNEVVSRYTKERAKGYCDLCDKEAPFKNKNGEPYLENHHLITLADGGPDVTYNTVALCPNCHRKIHALKDKKDTKKLMEKIHEYILHEDDKDQIEKYERLFHNIK